MTNIATPTALALQLADAYANACFTQGLNQRTEDPAPENAREKLAANLAQIDDHVAEIGRLRNVIQAACLGGTDLMIERWKALFPDAPVPTVHALPSPAEGDDMLEPLIYAAIMHSGRPKTIGDFEQAAANVADMLKRRAKPQPKGAPVSVPPNHWDEWAMKRAREFTKRLNETHIPPAMLTATVHCALIDAMFYAAPAQAPAPAPEPVSPRPFNAVKSFADSVLAMLDERIKAADRSTHPFNDYFGDKPEVIVAAKAQASELREVRTQVRILGDRALVDLMKFKPAISAPAVTHAPSGFALVSLADLADWRMRVNTLACLTLKAERERAGADLKGRMSDAMCVSHPPVHPMGDTDV